MPVRTRPGRPMTSVERRPNHLFSQSAGESQGFRWKSQRWPRRPPPSSRTAGRPGSLCGPRADRPEGEWIDRSSGLLYPRGMPRGFRRIRATPTHRDRMAGDPGVTKSSDRPAEGVTGDRSDTEARHARRRSISDTPLTTKLSSGFLCSRKKSTRRRGPQSHHRADYQSRVKDCNKKVTNYRD